MKNLHIFLLLAFTMGIEFCFGQTFVNENGIVFKYEGHEKTGSRYDEYCKTTFDIYRVKGTVTNNNSDKAAVIKAFLHFNGQGCNKIYSESGPTGGEVIDKLYNIDIVLLSKRQAPYWVNMYVQLLPNDELTGYGYVEVKQGERCPEPTPYFTYELIPGPSTSAPAKPEEPVDERASPGSTNKRDNDGSTDVGVLPENQAKFPGGLNAFRTRVGQNLDPGNVTGSGKIQTVLTFIVGKDGSITDVEANGANESFNKEAIRALRAVKTLWTPAYIDGQPVRYKLKLPLAIVL